MCADPSTILLGRYDAATLAREASEFGEPLALEKGIRLRCEIAVQEIEIDCDRDGVRQVFSSLIFNAIESCASGDVITIRVDAASSMVVFSVGDTGPGSSADNDGTLSDMRKAAARESKAAAGFELITGKSIVETHGGHLWVKRELGLGSTFYFTLPIAVGGHDSSRR